VTASSDRRVNINILPLHLVLSCTVRVSCLLIPLQAPLTKKEVEDLLKRGAYGALMDDDRAGDQFCEEDIDLILQRRTQVITIDSVGKGSTFAKVAYKN